MKKTLLLTLALMLSTMTFAQKRISYINEYFDSDDFPAGWTFEGEGANNWEIWKTHQAGGEPNEIKLYWKPSFTGVARMVTPALNMTDVREVIVSFKGFLDNYQDVEHKLGIATTSDDGNTWNVAWQESFASHNQGQHSFIKTIATSDLGRDNVKFCIFFEGQSGNINGWYFDDINIYTTDELNLGLLSVNIPEISTSNDNEISFNTKNVGLETITSFSASYQIDDNKPVTQEFSTELSSLSEKTFSFQKKADINPGTHNITVSILNVNNEEDVTSDNVVTKEINVAWCSLQKKPMIEHFSSPTCGPCVAVNEQMVLLTEKYQDKYTYTKYPANKPDPGDPYYTDECRDKKTYYNVLGYPTLFLNGDLYGNSHITADDFEKEMNKPAYIDIKGAFNVNEEDNTINVTVDVMPFVNLYQKRVFISVNEKTTTKNVGFNGETEFHHIMMKMLPDAEGYELDLKANEVQHFEYSYNMSNTFMEELNDLEVAVWIQDYYDYVIYNSNYMYEYTEHPYPVQNLQLSYNENDKTINASWDAPEKGSPIGYDVYVNDILEAKNITETSLNIDDAYELNIIRVVAVYENDKYSIGIFNSIFVEGDNTDNVNSISEKSSFNIYPNPANDIIYIQTNSDIEEVRVHDIYGRVVRQQAVSSIDIADLKAGIYFVKVVTNDNEIVKRFIKL